ncbi:MAG: DinB family protein [Flavobacteriaceae bacterium]
MEQSSSLEQSLQIWEHNQNLFLEYLKNMNSDQLHRIPEHFNNNIFWNIAHVLTTRMLLTYGLAGHPIPIDSYWIEDYRKGTKPKGEASADRQAELSKLFPQSLEQLKKDLKSPDAFAQFSSYTTSTNFQLNNIRQAIAFSVIHDGIHLGSILALRKFV